MAGGIAFTEAVNNALDYSEMKQANWKNPDKYFHAKANITVTHREPGGEFFAEHFSNLREIIDQRFKGDTKIDALEDQNANIYGRIKGWNYRYYEGQRNLSKLSPNIDKIIFRKIINYENTHAIYSTRFMFCFIRL